MQYIFYIKTRAGVEVMAERAHSLTLRQRQMMLLCSGQRPLTVLIELFGDAVVRELHELVCLGYLQAIRQPVEASARAAQDVLPDHTVAARLRLARDFATMVARSLDTAQADALAMAHEQTTEPDAVLEYAAGLVRLLFRHGDVARAERVGYKLADLLPRDLVPMFVDCMLDSEDPQFAAALYEHLLSDKELPVPT